MRTQWIIDFSANRNIKTNYLAIYFDHLEDNKRIKTKKSIFQLQIL